MEAYVLFVVGVAKSIVLSISGLSLIMGLLAIISPQTFAAANTLGNRWIDTWRFFKIPGTQKFQVLDRWVVDLDRYALRHSRLAGIAVCGAAIFLGYIGLAIL